MNASVSPLAKLAHVVWRGDQMGGGRIAVTASGHAMLDRALPNGGWPASALIELLLQQSGIGELRLLKPALCAIAAQRRVALVQPPYLPHARAWANWGLAPERLLWIRTTRTNDALWAAEQILRNGSCGALLFWQPQIRTEALRRLHLAAQHADTVFWMLRPLSAAGNSSPAPLRLGLRPAAGGISIEIVKRRGPQSEQALHLAFDDLPAPLPAPAQAGAITARPYTAGIFSGAAAFSSPSDCPDHAPVDRRPSAVAGA